MEHKAAPMRERSRVAVIGLGLHGVTILKNLVEQGFDTVGFERNNHIGGLWKFSKDPNQTTVLNSTRANVSKQRNGFPDFPFPDETPDYPTGEQVSTYIESYASHFDLAAYFRLGVVVTRLDRCADGNRWALDVSESGSKPRVELFDRVVVTTGAWSKPHIPGIDGSENFKGKLLHSQAFKDQKEFEGKRVVIVGMSHTGCDIAVDLTGIAAKVFLSHRAGSRILARRTPNGTPLDHRSSRSMTSFGLRLNTLLPSVTGKLAEKVVEREMQNAVGGKLRPEWKLLPAPPIRNVPPVVNDRILEYFASGMVEPVVGIRRFLPAASADQAASPVELADGKVLDDIDVVILATGYESNFDFLGPAADPTAFKTPEWDQAPHSSGLAYPRLYQGLLSLAHPHTLAFVGPCRGHSVAAFSNLDLSGQAIARIWSGHFDLPPQREMEAWCEANYQAALADVRRWRIAKVGQNPWKLERWLNDASGNRVNECLGWGIAGWRFWWKDRELCNTVLHGVDTPYVYRLFEPAPGGRKAWPGAREAILKANKKKPSTVG